VLILRRAETIELSDLLLPCIQAVREAFIAYGSGHSLGMARMHIDALEGGVFHLTAGGLRDGDGGRVGLKLNGRFPPGPGGHGQRVTGAILLSDATTGTPVALMDSMVVTGLRTAAITAVVVEELARPDASRALLIGAGRQGRGQVDALVATGRIRWLAIADAIAEQAEVLARYAAERGLDARAVDDPRATAGEADVVVTITPSREPILGAGDVAGGAVVIALGADGPGKQELDPGLLAASLLVVDNLEQAAASGDLQHALAAGVITREQVHAELGDILAGTVAGRTSSEQTFVFDGTGTALQDIAAASLVATEAQRRGIGLELALDH
jgi:alanine dehydrogenase